MSEYADPDLSVQAGVEAKGPRLNREAGKNHSRQIRRPSMLFGSAGLLDFGLLTRIVRVPKSREIAHAHQSSLQGLRNSSECVRPGGWKSR